MNSKPKNKITLSTIGRQLFAFLSSLQLAVVLLLSLAAILAVGTYIESDLDAAAAKHYVYSTWWFAAFLGVLGLNVLFAGLSRYPWKRHHTGFLTVHLGILILLAGSLITVFRGVEGQLIIPEGETRHRIFLTEERLYFYDGDQNKLEELPANFRFDPPTAKEPYGGRVFDQFLVRVIDYFPHAQMEPKVIEGQGEPNAALQVELKGSRAELKEWLFAQDYNQRRVELGPASLTFLELPTKADLVKITQNENRRGPHLWVEGEWFPITPGSLGQKISLKDRRRFIIDNLFPEAVVSQGHLINRSERPLNPAALVTLIKGEEMTEHRVFARFSHWPTAKANQGQAQEESIGKIRLFWFPEDLGAKDNELVLAKLDSGEVVYALRQGGFWRPVKALKLGEKVQTGWMDFEFSINQALKRAEVLREFREVKVPAGKNGPAPAIRLQVASGERIRDFWLGRGQAEDLSFNGKPIKVAYASKSLDLGFKVKLKDFNMEHYEGTQDPASYESFVTLIDERAGETSDHHIAMNQPLKRGNYKIFQASYQINPDGPDWSVFSVAYDPGIGVKYAGSIILVLGTIIIFYFRKAYMKKPVKAQSHESPPTPLIKGGAEGGGIHPLGGQQSGGIQPSGSLLAIALIFCSLLFSSVAQAKVGSDFPSPKPDFDFTEVQSLAILSEGRKKPLDTFARETVSFLTGKEKFVGFNSTELLFSWLTQADLWERLPLLKIDYRPLIKNLQLEHQDYRVSPQQLRANPEFTLLLQTVGSKQQQDLDLTELEREGGRLGQKLQTFYNLAEGANLNIIPRSVGGWDSLAELSRRYPKISLTQKAPTPEARMAAGVQGLLTTYYQGDAKLFGEIAILLKQHLQKSGEALKVYPSEKELQREIHFNQLKPFQWAWVGYAIGAFLLALSFALKGKWLYILSWGVFLSAFGLHIYGFILRILISGRAPVTNMYETVLWIPFGAMFFAFILEAIYRNRFFLLGGSIMAALGLIVAQSAPSVLDPAIDPLVPVLRDNFWLTVHVLSITLSYGAFTLALGVANLNVGFYIFAPQKTKTIAQANLFIYRAIQIGVVLLAAGTILGGVWADQSWGRFWGWDPKEVWALIALLGYLAILHGRYAGWVKGFGLTIGSILAYLLILMAWYGVNFILGVGLHSYGFSSGGAKFVAVFTGVELLWAFLAVLRRYTKPPQIAAS